MYVARLQPSGAGGRQVWISTETMRTARGSGDTAPAPSPAGVTKLQSELTSGERKDKDSMDAKRNMLSDVGGCDLCLHKTL